MNPLFSLRKSYNGDSLEHRVTQELNAFVQIVTFYQMSGDREKRQAISRFVNKEICAYAGIKRSRAVAVPFGSYKYGTYLPWSGDLDLVVTEKSLIQSSAAGSALLLEGLAAHFTKTNSLAAPPLTVPRARIPFLQLWVMPSAVLEGSADLSSLPTPSECNVCISAGCIGSCPAHCPLLVQVSLSGRNHLGLSTSSYASTMIASLPALRPLSMLLKHTLTCAGLNNSYDGGMSSHTILLLVVAYLRHQYQGGCSKDVPIGRLAIGLLEWYSRGFDAATTAVTAADMLLFRSRRPEEAVDLLVVSDPMDCGQNAARSLWRWNEVRAAFAAALDKILKGTWWPELVAIIEK